jgi:hypothetical protein
MSVAETIVRVVEICAWPVALIFIVGVVASLWKKAVDDK